MEENKITEAEEIFCMYKLKLEEGMEANLINLAHKIDQSYRFTKKRLLAGAFSKHIQKPQGLK